MVKLAIVIPAYKSIFFERSILSIAEQVNKNFVLYIGDDNSPDNLYSIVKKYEKRITISYTHFEENIGGKDLVAHWERCIDLVGDEEWIWLFSDDDIMDANCVENFYNTMQNFPDFDLFHFNVRHIDESGQLIGDFFNFPKLLTSEEFLLRRLKGGFNSCVVEYVFRKFRFFECGRFENFDLAWGSDDATWIKLGERKGIINIDNSIVYWRISQYNISPNYLNIDITKRKLFAQIEFANWVYHQAQKKLIRIEISQLNQLLKSWFLKSVKDRIDLLSYELISVLISSFYNILDEVKFYKHKVASFYIYKNFRFLVGIFVNIKKSILI